MHKIIIACLLISFSVSAEVALNWYFYSPYIIRGTATFLDKKEKEDNQYFCYARIHVEEVLKGNIELAGKNVFLKNKCKTVDKKNEVWQMSDHLFSDSEKGNEKIFFISNLDSNDSARIIPHSFEASIGNLSFTKEVIKKLRANPNFIAEQGHSGSFQIVNRENWLIGSHPVLSVILIPSTWAEFYNFWQLNYNKLKKYFRLMKYYEDTPQMVYLRVLAVHRGDKTLEGKTLKIKYYIRTVEDINGRITTQADPLRSATKFRTNKVYLLNLYQAEIINNEMVNIPFLALSHSQSTRRLYFNNNSWYEFLHPDNDTDIHDTYIKSFLDIIALPEYRQSFENLGLPHREALECIFIKETFDECRKKLTKNVVDNIVIPITAWRKCIAPVPYCMQPNEAGLIEGRHLVEGDTCYYYSQDPEFKCGKNWLERLLE